MRKANRIALAAAGAGLLVVSLGMLLRTMWPAAAAGGTGRLVDLATLVIVPTMVFLAVRAGIGLGIENEASRDAPAPELRRSDRLESIGEYTGAIAHDFNNLLTAVITPVQLLLADLDEDHPVRPQLEQVEDAAARGAALSRQLLAFSRKQVVKPRPHDLNEIVRGLEPTLSRLLGDGITLQVLRDPTLQSVVVDATQIEQIVVNLVVNARDAMPVGGLVTLATSNVDSQQVSVRPRATGSPSGHVVLEVRDTGEGFGEAVRARMFEPYFTTKEHGTGLGLASVFGIARQFGGFVRVESTPGVGSTFRVFLPAGIGSAQPVEQPPFPSADRLPGGSELVLVVDDQEPVRQVLVRAMTRFGYRVLQASSAEDALAQSRELGGSIDLLLTDVILPEMSGPELARVLTQERPNLKVLFVSGFADRESLHATNVEGNWVFLAKPFSVEDLLSTVRRILDENGGGKGRARSG